MLLVRSFVSIDLGNQQILTNLEPIRTKLEKQAGVRLVRPENIHITLKFFGDTHHTEQIKTALTKLSGFGKFKLRLTGLGGFPSKNQARIIWVGTDSAELMKLKNQLDQALVKIVPAEKNFVGHITIARFRKVWPDATSFIDAHQSGLGETQVKYVRLKESILTLTGPVYRTIMEVEL
ncbi:MAG: RNA 2',3'-cyclic phosphodiesterase [Candidatus Altiarchaeota archaeon]|nr:RNA 2',3'-cyclic phosphodiesterase [Candidatus Altiarchaeota archaeon]